MNPKIDPKDSEAKLILGAISGEHITRLRSKGISPDSLIVWGDTLRFVYEYYGTYKKAPSLEAIYLSFPDFPNLSSNNVDIDFLVDVTLRNAKEKKIREILNTAIEDIENDPMLTIKKMSEEIQRVKLYDRVGVRFLDENSIDRFDRYMERKNLAETGVGVGLRTGIGPIDKEMLTWMNGDLILIIGPPSAGKSFLLQKTCIASHVRGKKVLYVCPEMTEHNVSLRFDVMEGRVYGYSFSLRALRRGEEIDTDQYANWLREINDRRNWMIVDSVAGGKFTVDKLESLVLEHDPDIIGIDSLTQFTTGSGALAVGWIDMIELTNAIKTLATATNKVFVAIGPSVGDTFGSFEPAELHEIGLSRGAAYKPDIIISISLSREDKSRNIKIVKIRESEEFYNKMQIVFDPDCGRIG